MLPSTPLLLLLRPSLEPSMPALFEASHMPKVANPWVVDEIENRNITEDVVKASSSGRKLVVVRCKLVTLDNKLRESDNCSSMV